MTALRCRRPPPESDDESSSSASMAENSMLAEP